MYDAPQYEKNPELDVFVSMQPTGLQFSGITKEDGDTGSFNVEIPF